MSDQFDEGTDADAAIIRVLSQAKATDSYTAKSAADLGVADDAAFRSLVDRGIIRRGEGDTFYLPLVSRRMLRAAEPKMSHSGLLIAMLILIPILIAFSLRR